MLQRKTTIRTFCQMAKLMLLQESSDNQTISIVFHGATQNDIDKMFDLLTPYNFTFNHAQSFCAPLDKTITWVQVFNLQGHLIGSVHMI